MSLICRWNVVACPDSCKKVRQTNRAWEKSFPQGVEKSVDKFRTKTRTQKKVLFCKRIFPVLTACGKRRKNSPLAGGCPVENLPKSCRKVEFPMSKKGKRDDKSSPQRQNYDILDVKQRKKKKSFCVMENSCFSSCGESYLGGEPHQKQIFHSLLECGSRHRPIYGSFCRDGVGFSPAGHGFGGALSFPMGGS